MAITQDLLYKFDFCRKIRQRGSSLDL